MVTKLVEVIFTEEDRNNLKTLAKEMPKLLSLVESLIETIEILGDEELMESIKKSEKDAQEGRLLGFKELLKELDINENPSLVKGQLDTSQDYSR
jgi:hypothetical protein